MIRDELPGPIRSVEESSLSFPAGATKAEKTRILFSFVVPIVINKRYGQDYRLELTPDRFELIRIEKDVEATVDEASWANVTRVTTVSSGHQPASPQFPVVDVFSSSGARSGFSLFSGDPHGARIVFKQPLEVGRWELYELLDAAHQRFRPQDEGATRDQH